jgi:hypothetical protein
LIVCCLANVCNVAAGRAVRRPLPQTGAARTRGLLYSQTPQPRDVHLAAPTRFGCKIDQEEHLEPKGSVQSFFSAEVMQSVATEHIIEHILDLEDADLAEASSAAGHATLEASLSPAGQTAAPTAAPPPLPPPVSTEASATTQDSQTELAERFPIDADVETHSLAAASFNCMRGKVLGYQVDRVQVGFPTGVNKALKPTNLQLVEPPQQQAVLQADGAVPPPLPPPADPSDDPDHSQPAQAQKPCESSIGSNEALTFSLNDSASDVVAVRAADESERTAAASTVESASDACGSDGASFASCTPRRDADKRPLLGSTGAGVSDVASFASCSPRKDAGDQHIAAPDGPDAMPVTTSSYQNLGAEIAAGDGHLMGHDKINGEDHPVATGTPKSSPRSKRTPKSSPRSKDRSTGSSRKRIASSEVSLEKRVSIAFPDVEGLAAGPTDGKEDIFAQTGVPSAEGIVLHLPSHSLQPEGSQLSPKFNLRKLPPLALMQQDVAQTETAEATQLPSPSSPRRSVEMKHEDTFMSATSSYGSPKENEDSITKSSFLTLPSRHRTETANTVLDNILDPATEIVAQRSVEMHHQDTCVSAKSSHDNPIANEDQLAKPSSSASPPSHTSDPANVASDVEPIKSWTYRHCIHVGTGVGKLGIEIPRPSGASDEVQARFSVSRCQGTGVGAKLGILPGDVLVMLNGRETAMQDHASIVQQLKDRPVTLHFHRVQLACVPEPLELSTTLEGDADHGIELGSLGEDALPVVTAIRDGSPAWASGIAVGDRIVAVKSASGTPLQPSNLQLDPQNRIEVPLVLTLQRSPISLTPQPDTPGGAYPRQPAS